MEKTKKEEKIEGEEKIKKLEVRSVDKALWERFKTVVVEKTGKMHGVLGEAIEEALTLYLDEIDRVKDETPEHRGIHTHTRKTKKEQKIRKVGDHEVAYQKENGNPIAYPLNSRERRIRQIGKILMGVGGVINLKGLERIIVTQKVGDRRVVNDYKKTLEVRGWIARLSKTKYAIAQADIAEELHLPLVNGHAKIEHTHKDLHKIPEITNGGIVKY